MKSAPVFWLPYYEQEKGVLSDSVRKKVLSMTTLPLTFFDGIKKG